ncbi:OadG family transporter subunit [Pseudoalteromonas sp. SS15]|jgi:oxaloacetate decarboxylase gamma subunit|uniref:Probable oxaloacetate decarboxylase gamma chain n=1 Tax=Pseudoalteromonas phenolica TaxID=161398 RepID=A0A5S3YUA4_9GAMM|nr:OadG family transporter subunit [Pseudoalteromonas phenolica]MAD88142.1 oxaloacetate decarboxylase [Pseudoalteromonas sp.]TLX48097.1 oxaloacetate decarboxylase [Pseudoalteromonas phenolica]TMN91312.1 oxaloacetate decarboxylase [Pseudoalteromonas phenolica]TMP80192.1 oxaloacetate decarboxylase [Pseudoalteromonas phenolica]
MDIGALLLEAASLMLTGMVGVFAFLSILIFAVSKLSLIAGGDEPAKPQRQPTKRPASTGVSNAHIAAISAAIAQYRSK